MLHLSIGPRSMAVDLPVPQPGQRGETFALWDVTGLKGPLPLFHRLHLSAATSAWLRRPGRPR